MECNEQNFLSFWTAFCPFIPLTTQKIKTSKNEKNPWRYYHFTHVYHKWQSFDVWFLRYQVRQTEFFVNLDNFLPFYPPNNLKNQNFEKMKKALGDIIILHMCTTKANHMMYGSWDKEQNAHNFSSFWTIFCTFSPLTAWKIKIFKKWKKHLEILSFYTCVS